MPLTVRSVPARWLLLCVLAFGALAMHHVASGHTAHDPAMTAAVVAPDLAQADLPMPGHDGAHSPFHDCLAVLLAAAVLLLGAFLVRRGVDVPGVVRAVSRGRAARPPPSRTGRELLTARCVLRI